MKTWHILTLTLLTFAHKSQASTYPGQDASQASLNPGASLRGQSSIVEEAKRQLGERDPKFLDREKKRRQGQQLQKTGTIIKDTTSAVSKPLQLLPTLIGLIPDPHAKMAGIGARVALQAAQVLGKSTGYILLSVGRYRERSQKFLSTNEILINQTVESIRNYKILQQQLRDILIPGTPPVSANKLSKAAKVFHAVKGMPAKIKRKIADTSDALYITDNKTAREEEIKKINAKMKLTAINAEDNIRVLQIKILEDGYRFISKKLNKNTIIPKIDSAIANYNKEYGLLSKDVLLTDQKIIKRQEVANLRSKLKFIHLKIEELEAERNLLQASNESIEELKAAQDVLIDQIKAIEPHTKLGQAKYIQKQGLSSDISSKEGMIHVLKKLDLFKEALCSLENKTPEVEAVCQSD